MSLSKILKSMGDERPRLNELGKIKIGGLGQTKTAQGSGRQYRTPEKHDHFTITTLHRDGGQPNGDLLPDKVLMEQLSAQYADEDKKLRQIPIRLLSDEIDDVLQTAWVWYAGKQCGARSDGETVTWYYHPETRKPYEQPTTAPWNPGDEDAWRDKNGNRLFKLHSVFNCVVAAKEARWGGVYKFRTTSQVSFNQLYASLLHISQLTGGILRGMPLMLCVRPILVAPMVKGVATPSTVYVVHVELRGADLVEIQRQALEQAKWAVENKAALLETQRQYKALLVAPGTESKDEAADIGPEFQPEQQTVESAPADFDLIDADTVPMDDGQPIPAEFTTPVTTTELFETNKGDQWPR